MSDGWRQLMFVAKQEVYVIVGNVLVACTISVYSLIGAGGKSDGVYIV